MRSLKWSAFADEAADALCDQIAAMKENGVELLEMRSVDGINVRDLSVSQVREYKKELDAAGIRVWSIGSPVGKIGIRNGDFQKDYDVLKHCLDLCEVLKCQNIRLFSYYIPKGESPKNCRDAVLEKMSRYLEIARGSGVTLCHENEKGIYGDTAERCAEILTAFPSMGAIFDPANFIQCHEDTLTAWKLLAQRVHYMHIKDCLADGRVVPPGKGIGHLSELIRDFAARGGQVVSLEPHLSVFTGLSDLEREGQTTEMDPLRFSSHRAAFDAAAAALRVLTENEG